MTRLHSSLVSLLISFLICKISIAAVEASFLDSTFERFASVLFTHANDIVGTDADHDVDRYIKLDPPELIKEYGYPSETHSVLTNDAYILTVHRIPNHGKQPVLLVHGVLDSSASWLMLGPKQGLGFLLHNLGYDVWMLNARGNSYSTGHQKYDLSATVAEGRKYWNFSWHEIGIFDLPAAIDYILPLTHFTRIHYIGHSQGATSFFVMSSEKPEYNEKILLMTALAPPVFMGHNDNGLVKASCQFLKTIEATADLLRFYQFDRKINDMLMAMQNSFSCDYGSILESTTLCNHKLSPFIGNSTAHLNKTTIPILAAHAPAGASLKQLYHFGQLIKSGRFCRYDYGELHNLQVYGQASPPDYNLKNCTVKVAIIYAEADVLVPAEDVLRLAQTLPNVLDVRRVSDNTFNHMDFMWAMDVKELVYDYVFDWLKMNDG